MLLVVVVTAAVVAAIKSWLVSWLAGWLAQFGQRGLKRQFRELLIVRTTVVNLERRLLLPCLLLWLVCCCLCDGLSAERGARKRGPLFCGCALNCVSSAVRERERAGQVILRKMRRRQRQASGQLELCWLASQPAMAVEHAIQCIPLKRRHTASYGILCSAQCRHVQADTLAFPANDERSAGIRAAVTAIV